MPAGTSVGQGSLVLQAGLQNQPGTVLTFIFVSSERQPFAGSPSVIPTRREPRQPCQRERTPVVGQPRRPPCRAATRPPPPSTHTPLRAYGYPRAVAFIREGGVEVRVRDISVGLQTAPSLLLLLILLCSCRVDPFYSGTLPRGC